MKEHHPFFRYEFPAVLLGMALTLSGCHPAERPAAESVRRPRTMQTEPAGPLQKDGAVLPVYTQKSAEPSGISQTFFTRFAATEAEPEQPGTLDKSVLLYRFELPPEGMAKSSEDQVSLWLYAIIELTEPLPPVTLKTGSAGAAQIYLNGKLIYSGGQVLRPFQTDADVVPEIRFAAGKNLLVIHLQNTLPQWRFSLRFFGAGRSPLLWRIKP